MMVVLESADENSLLVLRSLLERLEAKTHATKQKELKKSCKRLLTRLDSKPILSNRKSTDAFPLTEQCQRAEQNVENSKTAIKDNNGMALYDRRLKLVDHSLEEPETPKEVSKLSNDSREIESPEQVSYDGGEEASFKSPQEASPDGPDQKSPEIPEYEASESPVEIKNDSAIEESTESPKDDGNDRKSSDSSRLQAEIVIADNSNEIPEALVLKNVQDDDGIKPELINESTPTKINEPERDILEMEAVWDTFRLACIKSNPSELRELALDAIQKLIAHEIFSGEALSSEVASVKQLSEVEQSFQSENNVTFLIDDIIETVCNASVDPSDDSSLQVQIIKVILTAVTSDLLHGKNLKRAVEKLFYIYGFSKHGVNQITARGTLLQIVNLIFQRMENNDSVPPESVITKSIVVEDESESQSSEPNEDGLQLSGGKYGYCVECQAPADRYCATTNQPLCSFECKQKLLLKSTLDNTEVKEKLTRADDDDEATEQKSESKAVDVYMRDAHMMYTLLCKYSMLSEEQVRSQVEDVSTHSNSSGISSIFSMINNSSNNKLNIPSITLRIRQISLELILNIFTECGARFKEVDSFAIVSRKELTFSLSKNGMTSNLPNYRLSLEIFLLLLKHFRIRLKPEIEVLLVEVFLKVLDIALPPWQKLITLNAMHHLCKDPQTLVDFYVNYDCELGRSDVFGKIVTGLRKLAIGKNNSKDVTPNDSTWGAWFAGGSSSTIPVGPHSTLPSIDECFVDGLTAEKYIKAKAISCLLDVVRSLLFWVVKKSIQQPKDMEESKEPTESDQNETVPAEVKVQSTENHLEPNQVEYIREQKSMLASAIRAFNLKPNNLKPFINAGFLKELQEGSKTDNHEILSEHVNVLRSTPGIYKKSLGELLGDHLQIPLMHAFIDSIELDVSKGFLSCLRSLLGWFRLPGEAQKVDRIMEKFAQRFCASVDSHSKQDEQQRTKELNNESDENLWAPSIGKNSTKVDKKSQKLGRMKSEDHQEMHSESGSLVITDADTIYTLAFSVIMLNTDLHSGKIKDKMDREAFVKNNRGIHTGHSDLPRDFLCQIYDEISRDPLRLDEDLWEHAQIEESTRRITEVSDAAILQDSDDDTFQEVMKEEEFLNALAILRRKSEVLLKREHHVRKRSSNYRSATHPDYVKPMFQTIWTQLLSVISTELERCGSGPKIMLPTSFLKTTEYDAESYFIMDTQKANEDTDQTKHAMSTDEYIVSASLGIFKYSIRLSCMFNLQTELNAFVSGLAQLTQLFGTMNPFASKSSIEINMVTQHPPKPHSQNMHAPIKIESMKPKHIAALRSLLSIAFTEGNDLNESWMHILSCVSQMERVQLITSENVKSYNGTKRNREIDNPHASLKRSVSTAMMDKIISELQSQPFLVAVDRIFSSTVTLSGTAIVHFFKYLVQISLGEMGLVAAQQVFQDEQTIKLQPTKETLAVAKGSNPRLFGLQKIVEITYYNMSRMRWEWSKIWRILLPYFNHVCCHPDFSLATSAIDSLRQLSMKFLDKDELDYFHTQADFLKPFECIVKWDRGNQRDNLRIREIVVNSLKQMVGARARNVKSGWKSVFIVYERITVLYEFCPTREHRRSIDQMNEIGEVGPMLARQRSNSFICEEPHSDSSRQELDESYNSKALTETAFANLKLIASEYFDYFVNVCFVEFIGCVLEFVSNSKDEAITLEAIVILKNCTAKLVGYSEKVQDEIFYLLYFPIISALSRIVVDHQRFNVRMSALNALFVVLNNGVNIYSKSAQCWKTILRSILLPILEDMRDPDWMTNIIPEQQKRAASLVNFQKLRQLYSEQAISIWCSLLRQLVDLTTNCQDELVAISQDSEGYNFVSRLLEICKMFVEPEMSISLCETGVLSFFEYVARNGYLFNDATWVLVIKTLEYIFEVTLPAELSSSVAVEMASIAPEMEVQPYQLDDKTFNRMMVQCAVHLSVLQHIRDIFTLNVATEKYKRPPLEILTTCLPRSHLNTLINLIQSSNDFAKRFHDNQVLRLGLWRAGHFKEMPKLIKQETSALQTILVIYFRMYRELGDQGYLSENEQIDLDNGEKEKLVDSLVYTTTNLLKTYAHMLTDPTKYERDLLAWSCVVVLIYNELMLFDWNLVAFGLDDEKYKKYNGLQEHIREYFFMAIRLIITPVAQVRSSLQQFLKHVGMHFFKYCQEYNELEEDDLFSSVTTDSRLSTTNSAVDE